VVMGTVLIIAYGKRKAVLVGDRRDAKPAGSQTSGAGRLGSRAAQAA